MTRHRDCTHRERQAGPARLHRPRSTGLARRRWRTGAVLLALGLCVPSTLESRRAPDPFFALTWRVLAEAGDVSTPAAAQATLDALAARLSHEGGGFIVVDRRVPREFKPQNTYQSEREQASVTLLDVRDGYLTIGVPPVGHDSRGVWSDLRVRRTLDLHGGSLPHWGTQAATHIENNIVQGSYSYMQLLLEEARAGRGARLYLQGIEGLAPGASMTLQPMGGGGPAGSAGSSREVIRIDSLGWDAETLRYYATADLQQDHPAGSLLQNKHNVPGLAIHNRSNADNQTFWLDGRTFQYGAGDQFVVSATHTYQSNVFSGLGDEGAVALNAEVIHDLDPFRAEVESFDAHSGRLVYRPGDTRSEKLALSRPLINLNPAKWLTAGHVLVVQRGGSFRGVSYPDQPSTIGDQNVHVRGGLIQGSADAPWDASIVGRYFAIDSETEKFVPGELPGGYWPFPEDAPIRRWYRITAFERRDDGTKTLRILRTAWTTMSAGSPELFREDNYTADGHERPLRYIIAPGAELQEIREGWVDTRRPGIDGRSLETDRRTLVLVPNGDRGTRFDFAAGDPLVQAVGPDPWVPRPLRIRMFDEFPSCLENPAVEIINNGAVARDSAISIFGGPRDLDQLSTRKDGNPPYLNGIKFKSAVGHGIRFVGQVRDAALMMDQRDGNAQPIAWRHRRGTTTLGVDPESGAIAVRGGSTDFSRSDVANASLVETRGISTTTTSSRNLRGIDAPVAEGAMSVEVRFPTAEPDGRYALIVQPSWLTVAAVIEKRPDGFRAEFGRPAPAGARVDWQLIR